MKDDLADERARWAAKSKADAEERTRWEAKAKADEDDLTERLVNALPDPDDVGAAVRAFDRVLKALLKLSPEDRKRVLRAASIMLVDDP